MFTHEKPLRTDNLRWLEKAADVRVMKIAGLEGS